MASKKAGDIMIPIDNYPSVKHNTTLREAVRVIEEAKLQVEGRFSLPRVLLVFNDEGNLLGLVRRRDIMRGLEPKFLKTMAVPDRRRLFEIEIDPNLVDLSTGKIGSAMQIQAEQPVSEVIMPVVATVGIDDHLAKIIYKMVNRDQSLLPVMKGDKVVGVVRSVDVFQEVARLLLIQGQ